jgi:CheY-like chemotaxis protein
MAAAVPTPLKTATHSSLARKADGAQRRILYAEDQVSSRIVTKAMLEKMGFFVDAVDDGEVAVELARQSQYDMILLDIEMPIMDGVTAARTIRAEIAGCKDTPILALSAFLADSTEHTQWRDAFDSAVPKPANSNELQRAMVRAMSLHQNDQPLATPELKTDQVSVTTDIWTAMKESLPSAMVRLLSATALAEMQHQALAMAAAREAGDLQAFCKCRHALNGLAANFRADTVVALIARTSAEPEALDMAAVFAEIGSWRINNTFR